MKARWAVNSAGVAVYPPVALNPSRWRDYGICGTVDPESWYPPEDSNQFSIAKARKICHGCPVRGECLEYALDNPEDAENGVWAGLYRRELRKLRRERKAVA